MEKLNATETVAIAKAISSKELKAARDAMDPGVYDFDLSVSVRGSFEILPDKESAVSASIPFRELFLHLANKTPRRTVEKVVREVMAGETDAHAAALAEETEATGETPKKPWVTRLLESLTEQTRRVVRGSVIGRGVVCKVDPKPGIPPKATE